MARYNTITAVNTITGAASQIYTITAPREGTLTEFAGTAPYTLQLPNPAYFAGQSLAFYNATTGTITLSTSATSGNIIGAVTSNNTSYILPTLTSAVLYSDGTNWALVASAGGGVVAATTLSASSTVTLSPANTTVTISPSGTGTVTINPASASTMDNTAIGVTTSAAGNFSSIGATTRGTGLFTTLGANSNLSLTLATGTHTISSNTPSTTTGTGALTIAGGLGVAGQATVATLSASTITGSPTISSSASFTGSVTMQSMVEAVADVALSGNASTFDYTTGNTFYLTSSPSGNMTFNFINVPTTNGRTVGIVVFAPQGSTPYIPTSFNINGSAATVRWLYNTTPTPFASRIDIYSFTLLYRSSAFTLIGTLAPGC